MKKQFGRPADFDDMMSEAETAATTSIRLRHEAQMALRLSEMPLKEVAAVLEEQIVSS